MNTPEKKRRPESPTTETDSSDCVNIDEQLKPFAEAATKFLQANHSSYEDSQTQCAKNQLEYQNKILQIEFESQQLAIDAYKKYIDAIAAIASGEQDDRYTLFLKAQMEYETDLWNIYSEYCKKVQAIGFDCDSLFRQHLKKRKEAYQVYLSDLKQAWSNVSDVDPRAIHAIATNVMSTINCTY